MRKRIGLLSLLTVGALALGTRGADAQTAFRQGRSSGSHSRTSSWQSNRSFHSGRSDRRDGNRDRGFRGDRSFRSGFRGFSPGYRSYYPAYGPVYDPYYDDSGYYDGYGPTYSPYPRYRVRRYIAPFPVPRVVIPLPHLPFLHWGHRR
jgi:hypothetical protein